MEKIQRSRFEESFAQQIVGFLLQTGDGSLVFRCSEREFVSNAGGVGSLVFSRFHCGRSANPERRQDADISGDSELTRSNN